MFAVKTDDKHLLCNTDGEETHGHIPIEGTMYAIAHNQRQRCEDNVVQIHHNKCGNTAQLVPHHLTSSCNLGCLINLTISVRCTWSTKAA